MLEPARRIELGFLLAAAALFGLLLRLYRTSAVGDAIDSAGELEAALALADEAS